MCRFKLAKKQMATTKASFNTSYVSVQVHRYQSTQNLLNRFNTSYVSVQDLLLLSFEIIPSVSIHLMCRFKTIAGVTIPAKNLFQYILCVGSSIRSYG